MNWSRKLYCGFRKANVEENKFRARIERELKFQYAKMEMFAVRSAQRFWGWATVGRHIQRRTPIDIYDSVVRLLLLSNYLQTMLPTIDKSYRPEIIVERPSAGVSFRTAILVWLTLQNSVHTLLLRYVRARDVDDMFLSSVAVFFTEIVKLGICVFAVCYEEKGYSKLVSFFALFFETIL